MFSISESEVIILNKNILTIDQLKKFFFVPQGVLKAVDGISFSVKDGETFGLVGESGSGKSTVAYTIIGIYKPTGGKIIYRGKDDISQEVKKRPHRLKKDIQIVFQDPGSSLNPARNIKGILEMPLKVHNFGGIQEGQDERVVELLEMVELSADYMYKYPWMLGGGEKQMVAIARALSVNPSLVLLDEPTSALDVSVQAKIIDMLIQFQKKFNLSYIFITHDLSLMRNVASRIAIMYLGKICEVAQSSEFFERPLHPYTQMLISSVPVVSEEEEKLKPKQIISRGEIPSPVNIPPGCGFYSRCPKKMKICSREDPEFIEINKGHTVRCHLYKK